MSESAKSTNIKTKEKSTTGPVFDTQIFLDTTGVARKVREFKKAEVIYSHGDAAKSIMYLKAGDVKLSVVSEVGKETVVGILEPGDFFGEGCLAGQPIRMGTATAVTPIIELEIEKAEMFKVLHEQHAFSDRFLTFMLERNIRIEQDLIDQLFNSSEKRLARTLLLPAKKTSPREYCPKCRKKHWRRWSVQRVHGSIFS